ncbi:MAG: hypothetical protein UT32_C0017G0013 [Parcubacteria group bacterium GW2011_GWC2_39_14]|nr:MAG: hypothetical protein UT32_C0017G0013 [Parcubacteria group bacterium GW2011_GWC2_39_14]KKR54340.1 MAG: hypothetical protein UT91_C0018G0014 [Parcubacteria group bacterium GW2011_GWA2_40_23]
MSALSFPLPLSGGMSCDLINQRVSHIRNEKRSFLAWATSVGPNRKTRLCEGKVWVEKRERRVRTLRMDLFMQGLQALCVTNPISWCHPGFTKPSDSRGSPPEPSVHRQQVEAHVRSKAFARRRVRTRTVEGWSLRSIHFLHGT